MVYNSYALNNGENRSGPIVDGGTKSYALFGWLYLLAQALGIGMVALVGTWMGFYRGGFGFQDQPKQEFRWHPLLMSTALLLVNAEAMLIYRGFRSTQKVYTKAIHGFLQFCGFLIVLTGLKAVLDSHNLTNPPIVNFYSVHSWIGILAVSLFGIQWIGGFIFFFKPGVSMELRKAVMPAHRLMGLVIFVCALSASLMGTAELSAFSMTCWLKEKYICTEMLIANLFAVTMVAFSAVVICLVVHPAWIRQPLPSELPPTIIPNSYSS